MTIQLQGFQFLPSLHTIALEVTVPNRASPNILLSRCGPSPCMLCFAVVTLASHAELPHPAPVPVARLQIPHLMLLRTSAAIAAWLIDPHCLLDISRLQSGTLFMMSSPAIVEAFSVAHETIPSLIVHPNACLLLTPTDYNDDPSAPVEATRGLALSDFRGLTEVQLVSADYQELDTGIPTLPPFLEVLILRAHDSLLSSVHLPALKRVELRLLLPHPAPGADPTAAIAAITGGFAHMLIMCDITGAGSVLISFAFLTDLPFV
ncbi:hypothetical protein DFH09DRAFT_1333431 [Mycena vulgaris]|nr:hypothetical protein DFH09DRAFT_1333431 [Mycena vulgaris]